MIKNFAYYELFASISVPDHKAIGYWVDLGADALGNIIKFYDPTIKQWVKLTDASSEYAVAPRIAANGNWFIDERDTGIPASGKNPYIGENGNWFIFNSAANEYTDTGVIAKGRSAYDIAVANGFTGTEAEWLTSLKAGAVEAAAQANAAATIANSAAARANRLSNNPPKIVDDFWAFYDEASNTYITSEFPSRGLNGGVGEARLLWNNVYDGTTDVDGDITIGLTSDADPSVLQSVGKLMFGDKLLLQVTTDETDPSLTQANGFLTCPSTDYVASSLYFGYDGITLDSVDIAGTEDSAVNSKIVLKSLQKPVWFDYSTNTSGKLITAVDLDGISILHDDSSNVRVNPDWVRSNLSLSGYLPLTGGELTGKTTITVDPTDAQDIVTKSYVDALFTELNNDALTFVGIVSATEPTVDVRENNFWYNGNLTDALPWTVKIYTAGVWEDRVDPYQPTAMDLWSVNGVDAYYYLGQTWHQIDFNGSTFDLTKFSITDGVVSIKPSSLVDADIATGANISQSKINGLAAISAAIPTLQSSVSSLTTSLSNKVDKSTQSNVAYVNSGDTPTVVPYAFEVKPNAIVRRNNISQIAVNPNEDTSKDYAIGAKQVMSLIGTVQGNPALLDFISNSSTVTSLANLNLNYATIYCTISSNQTISVAAKRFDNLSTQIYITNAANSAITMSIPNEPSFISVSGQSVTIPANSYTECSIMYDANLLKYRVVFFTNDLVEFDAVNQQITDLTARVAALETALAGVNGLLDNLLREP